MLDVELAVHVFCIREAAVRFRSVEDAGTEFALRNGGGDLALKRSEVAVEVGPLAESPSGHYAGQRDVALAKPVEEPCGGHARSGDRDQLLTGDEQRGE